MKKHALKLYRVSINLSDEFYAPDAHTAVSYLLANIEDADCFVEEVMNQRRRWVDDYYNRAIEMANTDDAIDNSRGKIAHIKFCQQTTLFIRHWLDTDDDVGISAPRHGDKYDRHTGIAVAFAKCMGEKVPEYI